MTEKVVIDLETALELLSNARDERGYDYVDPGANGALGCFNVQKEYKDENGEPFDEPVLSASCIAGTVFSYAGVPLEFLYVHNGTVNGTVVAIHDELGHRCCVPWGRRLLIHG